MWLGQLSTQSWLVAQLYYLVQHSRLHHYANPQSREGCDARTLACRIREMVSLSRKTG